MPSPPSSPPSRPSSEIDELKKIVLKLTKDMDIFQSNMRKEIAEIPQKVVSMLRSEGWTQGESRKDQTETRDAEDDVIILEPLTTERPEPSTQEIIVSEPMITEPAETSIEEILQSLQDSRLPTSTEIVLPKVYQRPSLEIVEDVEIPNVSLMSQEEALRIVESRFTKNGKAIMTVDERRTVEKIYKQEVRVYSQCGVDKIVYVDKRFFPEGKGKEIVDLNEEVRVGDKSEIVWIKKLGSELAQYCEGLLLETAIQNPTFEFNTFEGKNGWYVQADQYEWTKFYKMWLSVCWQDLNQIEIIGSSDTVLIKDIDIEAQLSDLEQIRQKKVKLNFEKRMKESILKLDVREKVQAKIDTDADFAKIVTRLRSYFGEKADDVYYYKPEEIIKLCQQKDCGKIALILQDLFKEKKPTKEEIVDDLANDMDTMTASYLKKFLKRHGYSSYELNKKNMEEMKRDAKQVQLNLIKLLDRESANVLLDAGNYNLPEGYDNRARFFSSQFPAIPTYRIMHWKFDDEKKCFLAKRVTGATHALYSTYEVARLTEEDLYELADLPLHNPSNDDGAYRFANFLKNQKRENFDAINFDNPESIRDPTLKFIEAEVNDEDFREIVRDQYLCLKYEHVPRKSSQNLLNNLSRWYLDDRTFEFVIERKKEDNIRFYHPAELNMFTKEDLIKLSKTSPVGKRIWNAYILESLQEVMKNLIACMPDEQEIAQMKKSAEKKETDRKSESAKRRSRRGAQQEKDIQIMD